MQGTNMQYDYAVNLAQFYACFQSCGHPVTFLSAVTAADDVGRRGVDCGAGGGHRAIVFLLEGSIPLLLNPSGSFAGWSYHLRHDGHPSHVHSWFRIYTHAQFILSITMSY